MSAVLKPKFEDEERAPDFIPPQIDVRQLGTLEQAIELLDEWIASHRELLRNYRRLELRCNAAELRADYFADLVRHLDPFLPQGMQDTKARAAEPAVYENIARFLAPSLPATPTAVPEPVEADPFS